MNRLDVPDYKKIQNNYTKYKSACFNHFTLMFFAIFHVSYKYEIARFAHIVLFIVPV